MKTEELVQGCGFEVQSSASNRMIIDSIGFFLLGEIE